MPISFAVLFLAFAGAQPAAVATVNSDTATVALPKSLSAWSAATAGKAAIGSIAVDRPFMVQLQPTDAVQWANRPAREPKPNTRGGVAKFKIGAAGTYQVAISDRSWIDVVGSKGPVTSIGHGHGPACSGITKIVRFKLSSGEYRLQLSGSTEPEAKVLISRD